MIPKTEIVYSWPYIYALNLNLSKEEILALYKKIRDFGEKRFKPLFNKYIDAILDTIPKVTGYKWEKNYIPIYLMSMRGQSFSFPLTIKIREDRLLMLVILIHELVHNNFYPRGKEKMAEPDFASRRLLEDMAVDLVTREVVKKLEIKAYKQIKISSDFSSNHFLKGKNKKIKPLPINLTKETIKQSSLNKISLSDLTEK